MTIITSVVVSIDSSNSQQDKQFFQIILLLHYLTLCLIFQVPLVLEGQEGTKDLRDQLVSLARRERKVKRVLQGYEDPEESKVSQDYKVCQG